MPEMIRDTFVPLIGSTFRVALADEVVELTLVEVTEARTSPSAEAFSVEFIGPITTPLPQKNYEFEHRELGRFELFIVPVFSDCDGERRYEAVFNRARPRR